MYLNGKHILVTGAAGFIGSNLIKRLLSLDVSIRATIHKKEPVVIDNKVEYIQCDLTNKEDCDKATENIDCVFMCAANTSGASVIEKTPLVHVTPNVIMNTLMLESAHKSKVEKFVFISSNVVYPESDFPATEDMAGGELFEKYFCAGWMKRFSEIMCEMYSCKIKNPMQTIVIRPGNIYGEHDDFDWETSHVLPALIRKVTERHNPIEVWGDGSEMKDFIYIEDFVNGMFLSVDKLDYYSPINIAYGKSYSIKDALEMMLKLDNFVDANIVFDISKPTMIRERHIDTAKAKNIGFVANVNLYDGLKKTIDWYKLNELAAQS